MTKTLTDTQELEAGRELVAQYLQEAHATEAALVTTLTAHIAMTPRGGYRDLLERHLAETRQQARAIESRLSELGATGNLVVAAAGLARNLAGQAFSLAKGPVDLIRGAGGEEKLLKNAKDECASEALEIATYDALETAAEAIGDEKTVRLARRHRGEEERMLEGLRRAIPALTRATVMARAGGQPTYDLAETGAADTARKAGTAAKRTAKGTAKRTARQARRVPGAEAVEGTARGAAASEGDLPIGRYDDLTAEEIVSRLNRLSQVDLRVIAAYEAKNRKRRTILSRIESLQADQPFAGYDELTADEVISRLREADESVAARVRDYEGAHQRRVSVLEAAQGRLAAR